MPKTMGAAMQPVVRELRELIPAATIDQRVNELAAETPALPVIKPLAV